MYVECVGERQQKEINIKKGVGRRTAHEIVLYCCCVVRGGEHVEVTVVVSLYLVDVFIVSLHVCVSFLAICVRRVV